MAVRHASAAKASEVLVSATTMNLLAGSELSFEPAGMHELKGLVGARELFRVAASG